MVHDACSALARALGTSYNPAEAPILPRFGPGGKVGGFVLCGLVGWCRRECGFGVILYQNLVEEVSRLVNELCTSA